MQGDGSGVIVKGLCRKTIWIDCSTDAGNELGGEVGPATYVVYFPRFLKTVHCLMLGCPAIAHSADRIPEQFIYAHFHSRVVVLQEGREPLPQCSKCGMSFSSGSILKHQRTSRLNKYDQMRWRRRDVTIAIQ